MALPWQKLPDADTLFTRYFDPWYDDRQREFKGFTATRPDLITQQSLRSSGVDELSPLNPEGQSIALEQIQEMCAAALADWKADHGIETDDLAAAIDAVDQVCDRAYLRKLIKKSEPGDFSNELLVQCCELGAAIGEELKRRCPALVWIPSSPYWESSLFDPRSGTLIPPFHWAIKRFSEYGLDDGLIAKIDACMRVLEQEVAHNIDR